MTHNNFEVLLKQIGTIGIARYVHKECQNGFLKSLDHLSECVDPARTKSWIPSELIGVYTDIDCCDFCGVEFKESDTEYISFWVTTPDQLYGRDSVATKPWWKFW